PLYEKRQQQQRKPVAKAWNSTGHRYQAVDDFIHWARPCALRAYGQHHPKFLVRLLRDADRLLLPIPSNRSSETRGLLLEIFVDRHRLIETTAILALNAHPRLARARLEHLDLHIGCRCPERC